MARKSRSKQRGKGVGSRSQSAGKSKGGSRSSAGSKGGSKSGGNKSGSGKSSSKSKSSKSKSSKSTSSSKGPGGGKSPSANKRPSSPPAKSPAPKKTITPAQQAAKDRIAAGKTVSQVKADNKASMKIAAKERDQKFQATKKAGKAVQTFGGTRSDDTYSAAEKKAITDAGYAVSGYAKASAKGGLGQDTVPAGSFNISEEGKALAAQQKAEAAAKKLEAEKARKAEEKRQAQFNPLGRLPLAGGVLNPLNAFTPEGRNTILAGGIDAVTDTLNFGKNVLTAGYAKDKFNIPKLPKYQDAGQQLLRNVSSVALPLAQGKANVARFRSVDPISGKAGFANEIAKMTTSNAAFKAGKVPQLTKTGITNVNPGTFAKAFTPQMVATGPTAGATVALNTAMTGATVGDKVKSGGLNIGSTGGVDSGETTSTSNTGRTLEARATRPGFDSLLGAADFGIGAITGKERTDLDRMGKGLFGKDLVTPRDVVKDAGMVAGKIRNNELSIGDVKSGYRDVKNIVTSKDRLKTIGDMNTKDLTRLATKGYDVARDSAVVQTAGERLGLPSDFKQQTDTLRNELKDRLSSVKMGDRDSTYKAISDFNRDIGTDPNLSLAARQAEAFRSGEGTTMQKIAAGFQPGAAKVKGLSAAERGIVGSLGNRIISGKQTDIAREAMSGMKAGSSLTAGNLTGIAQNVIKNTAPGADTVSAKRASQIKSLVTGGRGRRDITPGSLIRGVNPFRGSNRGGGSTPIRSGAPAFTPSGGGGGTPVGQVPQIPATGEVPQFQVPELPVQQGTDAGNLANIQSESYQNTFRNLMAINPNYSARFQMRRRRGGRRGSFKRSFSRRFFS